MQPGVYAIVATTRPARPRGAGDEHWLSAPPDPAARQVVDIRYLKNLLSKPLLMDALKGDPLVSDKHLIDGFQAASMPLERASFHRIFELASEGAEILENVAAGPTDSMAAIAELERTYADAVPEVKEAVSRRIERGSVAARVKEAMGFKCQICEALQADPIGFRKRDGEPYVEAHHVTFIATLEAGSLGSANLITVCANHHCQLHYGDAELVESGDDYFLFQIEERSVRLSRLTARSLIGGAGAHRAEQERPSE